MPTEINIHFIFTVFVIVENVITKWLNSDFTYKDNIDQWHCVYEEFREVKGEHALSICLLTAIINAAYCPERHIENNTSI